MEPTGLQLVLRSPESTASFDNVTSIAVTTTMGPMIIYPKYASLVGTINFSQLVLTQGKEEKRYMLRNGLIFIDHDKNSVTISALFCDLIESVNIDTVAEYLKQIETLLEKGEKLPPIQFTYLKNERLALVEQMNIMKKK